MNTRRLGSKPPVFVRWVFPPYAAIAAIVLIAAASTRYRQLIILAPAPAATGQLTAVEAAGLATFGLSLSGYARYFTLLEGVAALAFLFIAVTVFWLRGDEWFPLLFAFGAAGFGIHSNPLTTGLAMVRPGWTPFLVIIQAITLLCFVLAILLFPNGRFVPPWTSRLGIIWAGYVLLTLFLPALRLQPSLVWTGYGHVAVFIWALTWLGLIAALQVVRYRRYATPVEREQTKWVVWGLATGMGASILVAVPVLIMPMLGAPMSALMATRMVAFSVILLASIGMAASFAIAILYSRLWDIEAVINRTVVYGLLTAILAATYSVAVVTLQHLWHFTSIQQTQMTVVLTTLLVAALFNPLRKRVQSFIDRRFYRRKYDAQATLAQFGAVARDEVNLETLTRELLEAVNRTVQPTESSLWLRDRRQ